MFEKIQETINPVTMRVVTETEFREKLLPLEQNVRMAIEATIFKNQDNIVKFMYGHQPRHRVFQIVFYYGEPATWDLWRRHYPSFRRFKIFM